MQRVSCSQLKVTKGTIPSLINSVCALARRPPTAQAGAVLGLAEAAMPLMASIQRCRKMPCPAI